MRFKIREGESERTVYVCWHPVAIDWCRKAAGMVPQRALYIGFCLLLLVGSFGLGKASSGGGCTAPSFSGCHLPTPGPGPEPQPEGMQAIALVYETQTDQVTAGVWANKDIQAYLAAKVPDKFRLIDQNADVAAGPDWLKAAMAVPRPSIPWLVVQDAKGQWYGVAWPKTAAEALALLKKLGG